MENQSGEEGIFPVPGKAGTEPLQLPLLSSSADLKLLLRGAGSPLLHAVRVQELGKKKLFLSHFLSLFFRDASSTFPPTEQPGRSGDGAGSSSDHTSASCFTQICYKHALKTSLSVQSSLFGAAFCRNLLLRWIDTCPFQQHQKNVVGYF